ncbi:MAG: S-layer homology domain-containing protein, partial [Prochlorothrix sp.]
MQTHSSPSSPSVRTAGATVWQWMHRRVNRQIDPDGTIDRSSWRPPSAIRSPQSWLPRLTTRATLLTLTTLGLSALASPLPAAAQSSFADIRGHWAQLCVESLADDNIASGFTDAYFRPDVPLTRGLAADFLSRAFPNAPQVQPAPAFWDLTPEDPFYDVILKTSQQGFFSGSQGRFGSQDSLSRQDFFVALASGLDYAPTFPPAELLSQTYDDAELVAAYAQDAIAAMTEQKFVVSPRGVRELRPQASISR